MGWLFGKKTTKNDDSEKTEKDEGNQLSFEMLSKLLAAMDCDSTVKQTLDKENNIVLNISTDDAGRVIGEKGETLYSIQYLLNKMIFSKDKEHPKVIVDVDNYRSKRNESLVQMAQKLAERVIKTGKSFSLPPLNSYERKTVHECFRDDDKVTTQSRGEGFYKKIFISVKN
jgi:spoIIIJ-associated protein